jgi:hypothetical protein
MPSAELSPVLMALHLDWPVPAYNLTTRMLCLRMWPRSQARVIQVTYGNLPLHRLFALSKSNERCVAGRPESK